jgi:SH3-like domain-containing protein
MRIPAIALCGVLVGAGLLLGPGVAEAEKVKTNQRTEVYSRPGEASRVVLRLKEGQGMTVLDREGRWLKVRVKGRTGYVPRSKIDEDRAEGIQRNTRRRPFVDGRSRERGWAGGAPDDRVGADAVGDDDADSGSDDRDRDRDSGDDDARDSRDDDDRDDRDSRDDDDRDSRDDDDDRDRDDRDSGGDDGDSGDDEDDRQTVKVTAKRVALYESPSKRAEEVGTARKGDTFYFVREDGNWVMVENDEGDAVWVKSSAISRGGGGGGRAREGKQMVVFGGAGVKLLGQTLRTPNAMNNTPPDNYTLGTSAATIAIGGELLYPYGSSYVIGGSLEYAGSKAVPGISYNGSTTGVTIHDIDLRVTGGYDLKNAKGMIAYARLGYHYENLAIASVSDFTKNTAMIPSEIFSGPVIGGALDVANLTQSLALRVILDTMVVGGKRKQTENLEDGSSPSIKGAWLSGCVLYKWKPKMTINGAYELTYMKTDFGPQAANSMRHPAGSGNTSRTDLNHSITVSIGYAF